MLTVRNKLKLDTICFETILSYLYVKSQFVGNGLNHAMAEWRLELYDFLVTLTEEEIKYLIDTMAHENFKVHLELSILHSAIKSEKKNHKFIKKIKNLINFKKEVEYDPVCFDSKIFVGKCCNDGGDSGPTAGSASIC